MSRHVINKRYKQLLDGALLDGLTPEQCYMLGLLHGRDNSLLLASFLRDACVAAMFVGLAHAGVYAVVLLEGAVR